MNRKFVITVIFLSIAIMLCSFGIKNMILKRSKHIVQNANSKNLSNLYNMGKDFYEKGDYKKAGGFFKAVYERFPGTEQAKVSMLSLADVYKAQNNYLNAKETLEKFAELHPESRYAKKVEKEIED